MSAKTTRNRENQKTESHLLDHDPLEQCALQIARDEGRNEISEEDRERAEAELRAPNETAEEPELTPGMEIEVKAWDEAPASSGRHVPNRIPDDEASIGKELTEKGLRAPNERRAKQPIGHSNTL